MNIEIKTSLDLSQTSKFNKYYFIHYLLIQNLSLSLPKIRSPVNFKDRMFLSKPGREEGQENADRTEYF